MTFKNDRKINEKKDLSESYQKIHLRIRTHIMSNYDAAIILLYDPILLSVDKAKNKSS